MVGMMDYHLHYAVMATEDRIRDAARTGGRPIRPHRRRVLARAARREER